MPFNLLDNTLELGHGLVASSAIATPTVLVTVPVSKKYKPLSIVAVNDDTVDNPILVKVYKYVNGAVPTAANLVGQKSVDSNGEYRFVVTDLNMSAGQVLGFTASTINKITAIINGLTFDV